MDLPPRATGMYAWFVDEEGAESLGEGLAVPVPSGLLYVGQAGATSWPAGRPSRKTLPGAVRHQLVGDVRSSTFRFTLAAALRKSPLVVVVGPRRLTLESEALLSEWIARHLRVAVCEHEPDTLADLETKVLRTLDPPLNVEGVAASPLRAAVNRERVALNRGARRFVREAAPATNTRAKKAAR